MKAFMHIFRIKHSIVLQPEKPRRLGLRHIHPLVIRQVCGSHAEIRSKGHGSAPLLSGDHIEGADIIIRLIGHGV